MEGISSRHGGHQVAQKLRNTTWPFSLERDQTFPCRSTVSKSGAGLPTAAIGPCPHAAINKDKHNSKIKSDTFFKIIGPYLINDYQVLPF